MRRVADWIDGYMSTVTQTEPPDIFHRWVGISVISSCLQRRCWLDLGTEIWYPNLYVILIGPPGGPRKSTAMRLGLEYMMHDNARLNIVADSITRPRLIRKMKECAETYLNKDGVLTSHSSMTIYSTELAEFLGYNDTTLLTTLTKWYDCEAVYRYETKNAGDDIIHGVWVNILGATTPGIVRASLPPEMMGGGFASRVIFAYADVKKKPNMVTFYTDEQHETRKKLFDDIADIRALEGRFFTTTEFIDAANQWYLENDGKDPFDDERMEHYCNRRFTHLMKLSMVMCASRTNDMHIQVQDFTRALEALLEAEQFMPQALSTVGLTDYALTLRRVMSEIERHDEINFDVLLRRLRNYVSKFDLEKILESLESMGHCRRVIAGGKGGIILNLKLGEKGGRL